MAYCIIPTAHSEVEKIVTDLLKAGKVVAVPTDTLYGIACNATNVNAIKEMYTIKRRSENKAVAICLGQVCDIQKWAYVNHLPVGLLYALLPGPVTIILQCINNLSTLISLSGKIGIRIPNHDFIRNVCDSLGDPIALTSANISSEPSAINIDELQLLWEKVSAVIDDGILSSGDRQGSTVIDLTVNGHFRIIRSGATVSQVVLVLQSFGLIEDCI